MRSPDNREHPARRATVIALFLLWAFLLFAVYLTYQVSAVLALLLLATLITQFWPILHEWLDDVIVSGRLRPYEPGTTPGCHPGGNPINLADMVGREGVAISVLRPSGQVQIRAVRYDAVAEGGYLEAGTAVRVMDVKQGSLVVRAQLPSSS